MLRTSALILAALVLAGGVLSSQVRAEDAGQEDLDKATQTKLAANSLTDLNEVIRLCESAQKKGLDKDNQSFANELLSSTLIQRGALVANAIFESIPPSPRWPNFRRVALEDLERAVKLGAKQPEAFYMIARLNQLPGGDEKRAKDCLDLALQAAGDNPALRSKILVLRASAEKDNAKKLADLAEAIKAAPKDPTALRTRAMLYAQQDQNEKALADFDAALKLDPDHVATIEAKASTLAELKRYDDALTAIAKLRQLEPKSIMPLVQEARIQALQGNRDGALHNLNQAEQLEPGNVGVLLLRGMIYQEMKENDKALADVERVLKLRPGLEPAVRLRAVLLAGAGKFDLAIQQLSELIKGDPNDVESRLQMAMFYQASDQPRKAVELYSEVLQKMPDNHFALRGRADALLSVGKHAEAIADYEKALKQNAEDSSVLNNLAWVLATSPIDKLRNGKRAIELAKKACELTEYKQAHILSTLAAGYAETGDFETAKKWSRKAIELGPKEQKEALEKELASYDAGKPIREMQTAPEQPNQKAPAAKDGKPAAPPAKDAKPSPSPAKAAEAAAPKPQPSKAGPEKPNSTDGPQLLPSQDAKPVKP